MMNPGAPTEDEEVAAEDEEDMGVIETYSNYWPSKLKVSIYLSNSRMSSKAGDVHLKSLGRSTCRKFK